MPYMNITKEQGYWDRDMNQLTTNYECACVSERERERSNNIKHIYSNSIDFIQILGFFVHFHSHITIKRLHAKARKHISIVFINTTYEHPINH